MKTKKSGPTKTQLRRAREKWVALSKADTAWRAIIQAHRALRDAFGVTSKYRRMTISRLRSQAAGQKPLIASVVSLVRRLNA